MNYLNLYSIKPYDVIGLATLSISPLINRWRQINGWIRSIGGMNLRQKIYLNMALISTFVIS